MPILTEVIKRVIRGMTREMLYGPLKRETMVARVLPQTRPLAKSGAELLSAMREVGLSYGTTQFYEDLRDPAWPTATGTLPVGETQTVSPFLEAGLEPYRYDVDMWWKDPEGEWIDEEGVSWHREARSVWSSEPALYGTIIDKVRTEVEDDIAFAPDCRLALYAMRGSPEEYTVGGLHVYERAVDTGDPFAWR